MGLKNLINRFSSGHRDQLAGQGAGGINRQRHLGSCWQASWIADGVNCHVSGSQLEPSSSGGQSVVNFGADPEGKADSAPAFNKALQSLGVHGGTVSLL